MYLVRKGLKFLVLEFIIIICEWGEETNFDHSTRLIWEKNCPF